MGRLVGQGLLSRRRAMLGATALTLGPLPGCTWLGSAPPPVIGYLAPIPGDNPANTGNLAAFRKGLAENGLVEGSNVAIEFRWGGGQNLLREALLIADHDAYHLGEIVLLRRLLGAWHK